MKVLDFIPIELFTASPLDTGSCAGFWKRQASDQTGKPDTYGSGIGNTS